MDRLRIRDLAIVSQVRGLDSAGCAVVLKEGKATRVVHHKKATTLSDFLDDDVTKSLFSHGGARLIAGHCRAATIGHITDSNAHPYAAGKIVGMHNGTINSLGSQFKTDSQELFEVISSKGLPEGLYRARYGAYALCWVDAAANTLNFIRNDQRPLWFMRGPMGGLFWASEWGMLHFIRYRDGNNAKAFSDPFTLKENELFSINIKSGVERREVVKMADPPPLAITYKQTPPPTTEVSYIHSKITPETSMFKDAADSGRIGAKSRYFGFKYRAMTLPQAERMLCKGCSWCGSIPELKDTSYWMSHDCFICHDCKEADVVQDIVDYERIYRSRLIIEEKD